MQFALDPEKKRIEATKGARADCSICGGNVIAKCGQIVVHHWAHEAGQDCDSWFEPETEWHRSWKALFPPDRVEVPIGDHRADIVTSNGIVVELQNSNISPEEIHAREQCYKRMVWLVNAAKFRDRLFVMERYNDTNCFKLRWKHHRLTWQHAKKPVYLDLGNSTLSALLGTKFLAVHEHPNIPMQKRIDRAYHRKADTGSHVDASILLLNTLHASGWGSVKAFSRQDLMQLLGLAARGIQASQSAGSIT